MVRHFRRPLPHRFIPFPSLESPFRVWSGNLKWNSPRCGAEGWGRPAFSPTPTSDAMPSISIAEELAKKQREISISEFFERNKQILGYDSATKALLTVVKEAVDNSVEHDEPVIVRQDGWTRLVPIGEFIDEKVREQLGEKSDEPERISVPLADCQVLAYDD